mmetsp:Transcript_20480/g.48184  ORF Transcript_20480/g.48184 Transcript_20480/m.48184 type:complete len:405 (+) Transcript_20480:100-1314(+)|eukprot:CAMPEP_0197182964 /NCGR_PEP_ID=MMETSP1423-20130617/7155_1 /TAXON_ID=476441 /ORGANISM="Pseudo-nitzschia heimii, Strain UNC1101" /LENGTH=404 /DNA_ID=CAMNT_0042633475 /DNA_START=81 /DNA_END=1295 /DNA_ORIENTATION=-
MVVSKTSDVVMGLVIGVVLVSLIYQVFILNGLYPTVAPIDLIDNGGINASKEFKNLLTPPDNNITFPITLPDDVRTLFNCDIVAERLARGGSPPLLNFFSSAVGVRYEDILPLYAFFAFTAHSGEKDGGTVVEFVVPDREEFLKRHLWSLDWLQRRFSPKTNAASALCVRGYANDHRNRNSVTNTWRYLEVPSLRAKYTYIGDVDLLFRESVLVRKRFQQMKEFGLPYSNIVRDYEAKNPRLTGLMLLETEAYYTEAYLKAMKEVDASGNDEAVLFKIVMEAGIGVPPANSTSTLLKYRPGHGYHCSGNRGPGRRMCLEQNDAWLLNTPGLEHYRQIDALGDRFLSFIREKLQIQDAGNYTQGREKCLPTDNTTVVIDESRMNHTWYYNCHQAVKHSTCYDIES